MTEWREIAATDTGFPGYATLKLDGREIACVGIGPDVRAAMLELAGREKCQGVRNSC